MTVGRLIQPVTLVRWSDINLSAYKNTDGSIEALAQNVTVRLSKAEAVPTLTFDISPNVQGFEVFQQLKSSRLSEPITVQFSYPNSDTKVSWSFRFAGMSLTTGHDPKLRITGVSVLKGCWTDNKISYTMEEPITLQDFPEFLQKKAGDCAKDLKFLWTGQAKEIAAGLEHKGNQSQRTPHVILVDVLRESGFDVQVSDTALDGTLVISYPSNVKGEMEQDAPEESKGEPKPGVRNFHVISVGLMENITRDQKFNTGPSLGKRNSSTTNPVSNTVDEAEVVEPNSAPQETAADQQVQAATLGENNPSSSATSMTTPDPKAGEKRAALAKLMTTTCSFEVAMLPRILIRPRDIVVIPSLKGPGSYLEDWEVDSVTYKMDDVGGVFISVKGERPFTGDKALIAGSSVESEIEAVVQKLTTPEAWARYYWMQEQSNSMPLAG